MNIGKSTLVFQLTFSKTGTGNYDPDAIVVDRVSPRITRDDLAIANVVGSTADLTSTELDLTEILEVGDFINIQRGTILQAGNTVDMSDGNVGVWEVTGAVATNSVGLTKSDLKTPVEETLTSVNFETQATFNYDVSQTDLVVEKTALGVFVFSIPTFGGGAWVCEITSTEDLVSNPPRSRERVSVLRFNQRDNETFV